MGRPGVAVCALALLAMPACAEEPDVEEPAMNVPETITVTSTAFAEGRRIPVRHTCDGANEAPPLRWDGVPADANAVALVVDDPDAPRGTFTHWVVLDIPVGTTGSDQAAVPPGGVQTTNSAGDAAYFGPCPPSGTHRYRFTVYALSSATDVKPGAGLADALGAIEERAIARGTLTGVFSRG